MNIEKRDVRSLMTGIMFAEKLPDKFDQHFTYALGKLRRKLRDDVEALNESEKETLKEYNEKLDGLSETYGKKDEKGIIVMKDNGVDLEDIWGYNKALKALEVEYAEALKQNKEFFKEEIDVDIHVVENKYFPNLPGVIGDYLYPMRRDLLEEEAEDLKKAEDAKKAEEDKK